MKKLLATITLLVAALGVATAQTQADIEEVIRKVDELSSFDNQTFSSTYTMVTTKPGEDDSIRKMQLYRDDVLDKFTVLMLEPKIDRGRGLLQDGDNLFFYDPDSREWEHHSMKDNFEDSEAKNSDFQETSLVDDYDVVNFRKTKLGRYDVYEIALKANNDEVTYAGLKLWVTIDSNLTLKAENYSLNGRLMRTVYYAKYSRIPTDEKIFIVPEKMIIQDNLNEGEKTEVTIDNFSIGKVDEKVFTKPWLEGKAN